MLKKISGSNVAWNEIEKKKITDSDSQGYDENWLFLSPDIHYLQVYLIVLLVNFSPERVREGLVVNTVGFFLHNIKPQWIRRYG